MNNGSNQHRVVHLPVASSLGEYLERIRALGAVEGPEGAIEISPTLRPVIEAMHHVLAGGEVEVRISRNGQQDLFQELQQRVAQATLESNALNQGGVVVTAV